MLADIIPAKHRRRVYALVTLAAVVFGAYQASDGNWTTFVASVLTALTTGMATANTKPPVTGNEDGAMNVGLGGTLVTILVVLAILWLLGVHLHVSS